MKFRGVTFCCVAALTSVAASQGIAAADSTSLMAAPAGATLVSDDALASIVGKYILPSKGPDGRAIALSNTVNSVAQLQPAATNMASTSSAASPLANASGSGSVMYFGITMVSTWNVGTGAQAAGDTVGMNVGIDSAHNVSIKTWSTSTNGGVPASPTNDAVQGSPAIGNISSGFGQSIQVAGNGNTATNQANVTYGSGTTLTAVPTINTCGAQCTVTAAGNTLGVAINTPRGVVSQSIGGGLLTQNVQALGDLNQITNQFGVHIQSQPSANLPNAGGIVPPIPAFTGIP